MGLWPLSLTAPSLSNLLKPQTRQLDIFQLPSPFGNALLHISVRSTPPLSEQLTDGQHIPSDYGVSPATITKDAQTLLQLKILRAICAFP